ncbi:MAG: hypothetical protein KDA17_07710, partial [Candidatus Saccharibacteria bacterium]|nr:hypothetical protein [Candidatus Saccharibacteria bacterium]
QHKMRLNAFSISATLRWLIFGAILALLCSLLPIFGVCCRDVYRLHGHLSDSENEHIHQHEHACDEIHKEKNDFNVMALLVILCNVVMVVVTGIFYIRCHKRLRQLAKGKNRRFYMRFSSLTETSSRSGEKERARIQRAMWRQAVTQTIFYTAFIVFSMQLIMGVGVFARRRQKSTRNLNAIVDSQTLRSTVALLYTATAAVAPLCVLKFQRQLRAELYQMLCCCKATQAPTSTTGPQGAYSIDVRP